MSFFSLDNYRRITSNNRYIPEIDGLRFVAILTVLLLHLNTNYKRNFINYLPYWYENSIIDNLFLTSGWGVELFFALSGFILSLPFISSISNRDYKIDLKQYFIRRLTRLEPPFIISLVCIYVVNLAIKTYSLSDSIPHFLATLFYSHMFIYGTWSNINPISWSLETEVQFYLLAPLLVYVFNNRRWLIYLIIAVLFSVSFYTMDSLIMKELHLHKSLIPSLQWFLIGILVAYFYFNYPKWFRKQSIMADLLAWSGIPLLYVSKMYLGIAVFDLFMLIFIISTFKSISFKKFISNKLITTIGGMCYTIYLLHYSLIFVIMKMLNGLLIENFYLHFSFIFLFTISLIIPISFVFFRFFERPFMDRNWVNRVFKI